MFRFTTNKDSDLLSFGNNEVDVHISKHYSGRILIEYKFLTKGNRSSAVVDKENIYALPYIADALSDLRNYSDVGEILENILC